MELRQIRCFVAVYEERSFTRASVRLHVVQSAVSAMIRQLESMRDIHLFERTPLGVAPTPLADALYARCKALLRQADELTAAFGGDVDEPRTPLVVGLPPSMSSGLLSDLLLDFMAAHPAVQLTVREGYSAVLTQAVIQHELDFAIVGVDHGETRVRMEHLLAEPLRLIRRAGPGLAAAEIGCAEAAKLPLVLPTLDNPLRLLIEREFRRHGIALAPALELDSLQATLALVRSGSYATMLTASVIADVADLQTAVLVEPRIERSLVVVSRPEDRLEGACADLVGRLRALLAQRNPQPD
ncbi:LysR family transcriptional regulator [Xylophilus rhododendri]|uniref:LysR family transcriptional regulator n=1 Tax=Xylophilus rhododendri TaxID=2697032 RepID=A0A857JBF9_9BURK|nr:LysR family transcriptional regulator [Xylophilus rhododendri]QHJ01277.1 LysR family transcriptional regulator [Xylophilus rhododendri]